MQRRSSQRGGARSSLSAKAFTGQIRVHLPQAVHAAASRTGTKWGRAIIPGAFSSLMVRSAWQQQPQQEQDPLTPPPATLPIQVTLPSASAARLMARISWRSTRRISPRSTMMPAILPKVVQFSVSRPQPWSVNRMAIRHWQCPTAKSS